MANTYTRNWESQHPGCMIFLLDQSGSMSDLFGPTQAGRGRKKCGMVSTILNNFLNELITINTIPHTDGSAVVRPRADICVLGYQGNGVHSALSGALTGEDFVKLSDLQLYPVDVEMRKQKETDDTGREYETQIPFPIWVRPKADMGTPMCAALQRAWELASQWAIAHPDNYPPVVINVTDGMSTDGGPAPIAQQISEIATTDGQALLFNVHITTLSDQEVCYPADEFDLPNDRLMLYLLLRMRAQTYPQALVVASGIDWFKQISFLQSLHWDRMPIPPCPLSISKCKLTHHHPSGGRIKLYLLSPIPPMSLKNDNLSD